MAKQANIYVALVNFTDKKVFYKETYSDMDEAIRRIVVGLEPQAALNFAGAGADPENEKGKDWKAWGPSDTPFAFPST